MEDDCLRMADQAGMRPRQQRGAARGGVGVGVGGGGGSGKKKGPAAAAAAEIATARFVQVPLMASVAVQAVEVSLVAAASAATLDDANHDGAVGDVTTDFVDMGLGGGGRGTGGGGDGSAGKGRDKQKR
jgi:hypothetical protein